MKRICVAGGSAGQKDCTMNISHKEVEHIARLARMRLTEEETTKLATELSSILEHIAVLQEADVSSVQANLQLAPLMISGLRNDESIPSFTPDELLANAPERENDFARVRAVLE
jgi:aspartyl-tRNA(Asn)/glutamyl-tRNA(Gln) amidotransferase subunit C